MTEAQIQKKILDFLKERMYNVGDLWVTRLHTGMAFKNQYVVIELSPVGSPDLLVLYNGRFIGLEIKAKGGRQRKEQKDMQKRIQKADGEYYLVRSLNQLKKILKI